MNKLARIILASLLCSLTSNPITCSASKTKSTDKNIDTDNLFPFYLLQVKKNKNNENYFVSHKLNFDEIKAADNQISDGYTVYHQKTIIIKTHINERLKPDIGSY